MGIANSRSTALSSQNANEWFGNACHRRMCRKTNCGTHRFFAVIWMILGILRFDLSCVMLYGRIRSNTLDCPLGQLYESGPAVFNKSSSGIKSLSENGNQRLLLLLLLPTEVDCLRESTPTMTVGRKNESSKTILLHVVILDILALVTLLNVMYEETSTTTTTIHPTTPRRPCRPSYWLLFPSRTLPSFDTRIVILNLMCLSLSLSVCVYVCHTAAQLAGHRRVII
mmetsp:Transcript_34061/g.81907  ORF Transcript_34061/g.81907 Transcript_34061/m.81907 type:complete len:226 (+) Transcript_34061:972-1649(+)